MLLGIQRMLLIELFLLLGSFVSNVVGAVMFAGRNVKCQKDACNDN